MKLLFKIIEDCHECPNIGIDQNETRYECHCGNRITHLCWFGQNDYIIKIPHWCPLPDSDTFDKESFEI
jgi:hypothetical protein